jgi:hypothetical protein
MRHRVRHMAHGGLLHVGRVVEIPKVGGSSSSLGAPRSLNIALRILYKTPQHRDKYGDVLAKLPSVAFLSTWFDGFYSIPASLSWARYSLKHREMRSNEVFGNKNCGLHHNRQQA